MTDELDREDGPLSSARLQRLMRRQTRGIDREQIQLIYGILGSRLGREFYFWLVEDICGTILPSMALDASDERMMAAHTYYREGRRWVGLELLTLAQDNFPELYRQMFNEALQRQHTEAEREERNQSASSQEEENDE